MLSNKDIRVENGNIVINGDKYPLSGYTPEEIMEIVAENSDITPTENSGAPITSGGVFSTIGDLEQTGITGASVSEQISNLEQLRIKTTAPVSTTVQFNNGIADLNLLDISHDAYEVISVYAWGVNNALSFSLFNWHDKIFKIYNITNPTYTGALNIVVIYHK